MDKRHFKAQKKKYIVSYTLRMYGVVCLRLPQNNFFGFVTVSVKGLREQNGSIKQETEA